MLPLVDVFGVGVAGEPVKEVDIPSLLWIPPVGKAANGTLVAVGQIWHGLHDPPGAHGRRLIARRSQTLGPRGSGGRTPCHFRARMAAGGAAPSSCTTDAPALPFCCSAARPPRPPAMPRTVRRRWAC